MRKPICTEAPEISTEVETTFTNAVGIGYNRNFKNTAEHFKRTCAYLPLIMTSLMA